MLKMISKRYEVHRPCGRGLAKLVLRYIPNGLMVAEKSPLTILSFSHIKILYFLMIILIFLQKKNLLAFRTWQF